MIGRMPVERQRFIDILKKHFRQDVAMESQDVVFIATIDIWG